LQRKGTKSKPFYRVIIQNSTEKCGGEIVDLLGQYDPLKEPSLFKVDAEKVKDWLKKGATPTPKLRILLGKAGIMEPIDLSKLTKRKSKSEASVPKAEAEPVAAELALPKNDEAQPKPLDEAQAKEAQQ